MEKCSSVSMEANAEKEIMASGGDKDTGKDEKEELQRALAKLTMEDVREQVQSCRTSVDFSVNTDPDWEDQVMSIIEYGSRLMEQYNALKLKQQQDELDFHKHKSQLEKKTEEAIKEHQALLDKLESVRVKLQLNNSKTTRKNFLSKKQEMTSEKSRAEEERNRLARELEESEVRLVALEQEQQEEQSRWQQELTELRQEMEHAQKEAQGAQLQAVNDEIKAVEKQRDVAMERIEAWLTQVGVYLNGLRQEFPHRYRQEKPQWEKKEGTVRRTQGELQSRFRDVLQQLREGQELESLQRISLPVLPPVPTSELYFSRIMQHAPRPQALPPPHFPPSSFNPMLRPRPFPPRHTHFPERPPFPQQHFQPPSPHYNPPHFHPASLPVQVPPPSVTPAPSAAAGKLGKLLEKLGGHFPQCSRAQLTSLLQQVKSERGTLAGLSIEEVVEQVRVRLAQRERPTLGPIQRPATATTSPLSAPVPASRKPCLVCQNPVEPSSRFPLNCHHTVHSECIRVWLQSSKTNSCPFCPNK